MALVVNAFDLLVNFLCGQFTFTRELQCFWMAIQGAMTVRNSKNKDRSMNWFHAFSISCIKGYGGSLFAPLWMGRPTSLFTNDVSFGSCVIAFTLVNFLPFDIGYKLGNSLPVRFITVLFSQLFKTMGIVSYVTIAFNSFKDNPSPYYPIPVFGPILWASVLGNMGSFFLKGFDGHLQNGVPWPFQNGFFCASFYHFYTNDRSGPVGIWLRWMIQSVPGLQLGLDEKTFATVFISAFMQIVGILQMPELFGSSFSPFTILADMLRHGYLRAMSFVPGSSQVLQNGAGNGYPVPSMSSSLNGESGKLLTKTKRKRSRRKNKEKES